MKIEKRTDKKYPYRVTLSNGRTMKVAKQSKFSTKWLRKHGCPFISQYEVYQYLGMNTKDLKPMDLWNYAKEHLKKYLHATLVIKGLLAEVKHFVKGKAKAKYYSPNDITKDKITRFLKAGSIIILTRGKYGIHYYTLVYDDDAIWAIRFRGCTIKKRSAKFIVKTRSKNKKYGGMIVITPNKPKKPSKPKKTTTKKDTTKPKKVTKKVVDAVIAGEYGNGETRKKKLKEAGYDYRQVQDAVNERLK